MERIVKLAKQFDHGQSHIIYTAPAPTEKSVAKIEEHFGHCLPMSLITFAKHSEHYGNWLASLGEDYDSRTHIININNQRHNEPNAEERLPQNFLIINVGYDDDFDCMDLETYDNEADEYLISYWYPGIDLRESTLYESFFDCMAAQVRGW